MKKARKIRREPRDRAAVYWEKAHRYAKAARANAAEGIWDPAAANAINACINITDAVCVHYRQMRNASNDHDDALELMGEIQEAAPKLRKALYKHLGALLDMKNLVQYEARLMEEGEVERALEHMESAIRAVEELARQEGWKP